MQGSLIAAPCNQQQRDQLERILHSHQYPDPIGLTLVDDILVVRVLGNQIEPILEIFTQLWTELTNRMAAQAGLFPAHLGYLTKE